MPTKHIRGLARRSFRACSLHTASGSLASPSILEKPARRREAGQPLAQIAAE
jgi:hypothetical protein